MDLRIYFEKVRKVEETLDQFVIVASIETPDGGRTGTLTEVHRGIAARLIVDQKARLATQEETETFHRDAETARAEAIEAETAANVRVNVISDAELRSLRNRK